MTTGPSQTPVGTQAWGGFGSPTLVLVIFLFFMVNLFQNADRVILAVLLEPIRKDLNLADDQVGALGFAFAITYGVAGLVVGRLADTSSRRRVLIWSVGLFSLATIACGWAQNFVQLFIGRVVVGGGEAGSVPSKYSMVGDLFRPEHRASALSLVQAGLGIGSTVGLVGAGLLADTVGWRMTFVCFGVPGLLLALSLLLVREPPRGAFELKTADTKPQSIAASLAGLFGNRSYLGILVAYTVAMFALMGMSYWLPSYLVRTFDLSLARLGVTLGFVNGGSAIVGLVIGAAVAARLVKRDRRWEMWIPGICLAAHAVAAFVLFKATTPTVAFIASGAGAFCAGFLTGPLSASIQSVVSARQRGMATALVMFSAASIGQGLSPYLIGVGSKMLASEFGEQSLGRVLVWLTGAFLVSAVLFFTGGRRFNLDRVD